MKLSCTPISFTQSIKSGMLDLRKFIAYCASQGLDGVDLLDTEAYPWLWASPGDLSRCARWAEEEGLSIAAYACSNNFAKPDRADLDRQIELVKRGIERAAACGASTIRIFGGYHRDAGGDPRMSAQKGIPLIIAGLEGCLASAERHGVVLALENHGRLPGHSYESEAILHHFKSPWLKVTFDPANYLGNSMDEDENPLRAYERLRGTIAHVHLKDVGPATIDLTRRREPYVAGRGITPLRQIAMELERDGFDGFCALEYEASRSVPEMEGVTASLAYLREIRELAAVLQLPAPERERIAEPVLDTILLRD